MTRKIFALLMAIFFPFSVITVALADGPEPWIFWSNGSLLKRGQFGDTEMANFLPNVPSALAIKIVDIQNDPIIYWSQGNKILRAHMNTYPIVPEDVVTLQASASSYGLDVDAAHAYLYVAEYKLSVSTGRVLKVDLSGIPYDASNLASIPSGVTKMVENVNQPVCVAIDETNRKFYFGLDISGKLYQGDLDGPFPTVPTLINTLSPSGAVTGIFADVTNSKLYFNDYNHNKVVRSNLDGTSPTPLAGPTLSSPIGIQFDPTPAKIYEPNLTGATIRRFALDGTGQENVITTGGVAYAVGLSYYYTPAPTWTPTPTVTPTGTYTPTQTAASTPTDNPTVTPTATPTVTYTPTIPPTATPAIVPTSIQTPTITPTPVPTGNSLSGRIVDANGHPVAGVVVYLFLEQELQGAGVSMTVSETETGTLSTISDSNGDYFFNNIPTGIFRVEPNLTGLSFYPPEVSVGTGSAVPVIMAQQVNLNDEGCTRTSYSKKIVATDQDSRNQLDYAIGKAEYFTKLARRKIKGDALDELLKSLNRATLQSQYIFTLALRQSIEIPKIALSCNSSRCTRQNLKAELRNYRGYVNHLRRMSFFILRRARETIGGSLPGKRAIYTRQVVSLHHKALKALNEEPASTYTCTE